MEWKLVLNCAITTINCVIMWLALSNLRGSLALSGRAMRLLDHLVGRDGSAVITMNGKPVYRVSPYVEIYEEVVGTLEPGTTVTGGIVTATNDGTSPN